jgi:hypothetical protein
MHERRFSRALPFALEGRMAHPSRTLPVAGGGCRIKWAMRYMTAMSVTGNRADCSWRCGSGKRTCSR